MSFTTDVKNELLCIEYSKSCCAHAFAYGLLLFGGSFSLASMNIKTENENTVKKYFDIVKGVTGYECSVTSTPGGVYTVSVDDKAVRNSILDNFGLTGNELGLRINRSNIECNDCRSAFLAGAFTACGSISDPSKEYHLEFNVSSAKLSSDLMILFNDVEMDIDIIPKKIKRNYSNVIYLKESGKIADLIMYLGAINCGFEFMNTIVEKNLRNKANRISNCDTANLDKVLKAGIEQAEAFKKIVDAKGISGIPEDLRELAVIRMENPDMSLSELAACLSVSISKSGVNHRLKKLMKIAEEL